MQRLPSGSRFAFFRSRIPSKADTALHERHQGIARVLDIALLGCILGDWPAATEFETRNAGALLQSVLGGFLEAVLKVKRRRMRAPPLKGEIKAISS
jgi:hypothetical protein